MNSKMYSILLVEDDEVDIMNIERAFKKNNIHNTMHIARNGLEALEMLRKPENHNITNIPRIVLLDINMPKMGGLEFLQEIRKDAALKSLIVFMMTTSNDIRDKVAAFDLNVAGYFIKPLSFVEFVKTVGVLNDFINLCEFPH